MSVLDASAVLAWLREEPGHKQVEQAVNNGAIISTANLSEVIQKSLASGEDADDAQALLKTRLKVESVTTEDAHRGALLWRRANNLSLGDRLCLALADRLEQPALTAERAWAFHPRAI